MKKQTTGTDILRKTWRIVSIGISVLMFIIFASIFISIIGVFVPAEFDEGNVAVIPIEGVISTTTESFISGAKSQTIIKLIEKADEDDDIKAIILRINSPGGTPVATDEITQAVKNANKTVVAVIRETGASGAYWIASAADKVYANRMSITGSIGVKASRLEFAGLIADYNITYRQLTAGRLKEAGSPFKTMTSEEQQLFQNILDKLHTEFIKEVAQNRKLPEAKVIELATGFVYLGSEAKELGLVDELGTERDALNYLEEKLDIEADPVEYKEHATFFDKLADVTAGNYYSIGQGIGSTFKEETQISFT